MKISIATKLTALVQKKPGRRIAAVLVVLAVAGLGTYLLGFGHALTPTASLETENGTLGGAAVVDDSTASGARAVRFGASSAAFVTRSGNQLQLGGKVFRFAGPNMYWLGLDDNIRDSSGNPTYPTQYRTNNAFSGAASSKATVVRAHTLGTSVGCAQCLQPSLGTFNDAAFQSIDYAVQQAGQKNIRLIVPLTDQWRYYHGGKWNFVHWAYQAGVPGVLDTNPDLSRNAGNDYGSSTSEKNVEQQFYTNQVIVGYFKTYMSHLLNHVNQYTGVALKDDPTILAWETGNELFDAPTSWTQMVASYLKTTLGAKQLVADGSAAGGNHVTNAALLAADVDIVGGHYYNWPNGLDTSWLAQDAAVAQQNNKVYVVGEYGWSIAGRSAFFSAIENNMAVAGDLYWSLEPYKEDGTPEQHGSLTYGSDDVPMYFPGLDSTMTQGGNEITTHATNMVRNNAL